MPSDLYFLCILIIGVPRKVCYGSEIPPLQVIFCSMPPFPNCGQVLRQVPVIALYCILCGRCVPLRYRKNRCIACLHVP